MLKYLIIPLSTNAISFCHYNAESKRADFISRDVLNAAVKWAMMENLSVQFLYPSAALPAVVEEIVETVDHTKIVPADYPVGDTLRQAQVLVFDSWACVRDYKFSKEQAYIIRTAFDELLRAGKDIEMVLQSVNRLNVVITDIDKVSEKDVEAYKPFLHGLVQELVRQYSQGHYVQFNLITDRAMIKEMNNCNAGVESVAVSVDGKFFVCPGFGDDACNAVGSLTEGLSIKNRQLFALDHAPICRICDAFHCKRCVWLNRRLTHECNTPGRVQCIISHVERNASRLFLENLRGAGIDVFKDMSIPEIEYLDPFDIITNN